MSDDNSKSEIWKVLVWFWSGLLLIEASFFFEIKFLAYIGINNWIVVALFMILITEDAFSKMSGFLSGSFSWLWGKKEYIVAISAGLVSLYFFVNRPSPPSFFAYFIMGAGFIFLLLYSLVRDSDYSTIHVERISLAFIIVGLVVVPILVGTGNMNKSPVLKEDGFHTNQKGQIYVREWAPDSESGDPIKEAEYWVSFHDSMRGFVPGISGLGGHTDNRGRGKIEVDRVLDRNITVYVDNKGFYSKPTPLYLSDTGQEETSVRVVRLEKIGKPRLRVGQMIYGGENRTVHMENGKIKVYEDSVEFTLIVKGPSNPDSLFIAPLIEIHTKGDTKIDVTDTKGEDTSWEWEHDDIVLEVYDELTWSDEIRIRLKLRTRGSGTVAYIDVDDLLGGHEWGSDQKGHPEFTIPIIRMNENKEA